MREQECVCVSKPMSCWTMFTGPIATLESLRDHPRWFIPILISAAISMMVNIYLIERIGVERLVRAVTRAKTVIDPDAFIQEAVAHQNQILLIQAATTVISSFFIALLTAEVLWLLMTFLGYDIPFKKSLAVVAHVNMLSVVVREGMTALAATIARDLSTYDPRIPLATNPAFFLHPTSPAAFRLLASIDLITFVNLALLVVGLTKVMSGLSVKSASMIVVIPWLTYVGAAALITSLVS